jgi:hypothetical protein
MDYVRLHMSVGSVQFDCTATNAQPWAIYAGSLKADLSATTGKKGQFSPPKYRLKGMSPSSRRDRPTVPTEITLEPFCRTATLIHWAGDRSSIASRTPITCVSLRRVFFVRIETSPVFARQGRHVRATPKTLTGFSGLECAHTCPQLGQRYDNV